MNQNERSGGQFKTAADHFPRIDGGVVDCAYALRFIRNQKIALVEKEDVKFFAVGKSQSSAAMVNHLLPRFKQGAIFDRALGITPHGGFDNF